MIAARPLFALIGPNGAGKTSVLNYTSGIYRGEGRIAFRGNDIAGRAPHEIARLGLAHDMQMVADLADRIHILNLRPHAGRMRASYDLETSGRHWSLPWNVIDA